MAPSRKRRLASCTVLLVLLSTMSACYWLTSYEDLTRGDGDGGSPSPDGAIDAGPGADANPGEVVYPPGGGWTLAFREEFNGTSLDPRWETSYPRQGERARSDPDNGEAQWYLDQNVVVGGGTVKLIAKREDHQASQVFHYTSGMLQSKSIFSFRYGYIEALIRLPKGAGFHPAFWSWPMSENSTPEVDIVSFTGGEVANVSCLLRPQNGQTQLREVPATNGDWTTAWHTFAIDSEANGVTWYIDGKQVHSSQSTGGTPLYLILTMAVTNSPAPNGGTVFPATFEIDYIRAFTK